VDPARLKHIVKQATDKDTVVHFKKLFPGKYLQVADVDVPITVTIKGVDTEMVGVGDSSEQKLVATFTDGATKALVLNLTRAEAIAEIAGHADVEKWPGTSIRISRGRTTFKGKKVDCIVVDAAPATSESF
jgi:hypothetical protein